MFFLLNRITGGYDQHMWRQGRRPERPSHPQETERFRLWTMRTCGLTLNETVRGPDYLQEV